MSIESLIMVEDNEQFNNIIQLLQNTFADADIILKISKLLKDKIDLAIQIKKEHHAHDDDIYKYITSDGH